MSALCVFKKYSQLFGEKGKNFHSWRYADAALFDYIGTLLFAYIINYWTQTPIVLATIMAFTIGIIFHILFGVQTNVLSYLGIQCS